MMMAHLRLNGKPLKISNILKIDSNLINIKGTTTEKLGFLGREEGIACQSIVTVSKKNDFNF